MENQSDIRTLKLIERCQLKKFRIEKATEKSVSRFPTLMTKPHGKGSRARKCLSHDGVGVPMGTVATTCMHYAD